jgi:Rod binding domain-containing protein
VDITQLLFNKPTTAPVAMPNPSAAVAAAGAEDGDRAEQLRSVSRRFEAVFLHQIVKQMQETIQQASLDEEDESGEHVQSMYWSFMTDMMAEQGGLGFWKSIYTDLAGSQGIDTRQFPPEGRLDERL